MDASDDEKVAVLYVWDGGFSPDYMQIGSFQVEGSNWPLIFVTVPVQWAEAHRDQWNDILTKAAQEFYERYNAGRFYEGDGKYKLF